MGSLAIDPTFIKSYLRKGGALEAMKKTLEANKAYNEALKLDNTSKEAIEGAQRCTQKSYAERNDTEAVKERAQNDPEVRKIMQDPGMRMILEQMQRDPNAIKTHMQNPDIAEKISKLIDVGIVKMGRM